MLGIILRVRDKQKIKQEARDEEYLEFDEIKPETAAKIFEDIDRLLEEDAIRGTYNSLTCMYDLVFSDA